MASTSETGHAKNAANFLKLVDFITAYGATYNPSKAAIQLPQLTALHTAAESGIADVSAKKTAFETKTNLRAAAFSTVRKLSTRLIAALEATDASRATIADARSYNKKIQGSGNSTPAVPLDPNAPAPDGYSTSQRSFDQIIQHLTGLKDVLASEPSYAPNETDLQVASVEAKIANLKTANSDVSPAYTAVSNARIARDKILYTNPDSLYQTAQHAKKYIKSLFGAGSPEYAQVKGLQIRKPKL